MKAKQLSILAGLAILMVPYPSASVAADQADVQPLTRQAAGMFQQGNLKEAVTLQEKAIVEKPQDWLSHAALSYYSFQQGNVIRAVDEGQAAVDLAPHNYVALTNLALIKEGLDDFSGAMPLYQEACKVAADDWVPQLGLARCLDKYGSELACFDLLKEMSSKSNKSWNWYYELADTYLRLDKPELAVTAAGNAMSLAQTSEQKAASSIESLMVFLRTKQFEQAKALKDKVFKEYQPKDYQLYARTAEELLPANAAQDGKDFLNCALQNLNSEEDCEGFFRLGRIFEQKSAEMQAGTDLDASNGSSGWLSNAETAYRRSIDLSKGRNQSKYYLGLAGVLDSQGKLKEMTEVLTLVKGMDQLNTLAPFLISELTKQTSTSPLSSSPSSVQVNHCPVHLDKVQFKITNLNCGCQISKVVEAMGKVPGVAYSYVPSNVKPYEGTMLLDQAKTPLKDVLARTREAVRAIYANAKVPIVPEFETVSCQQVDSVAEAIRVAQVAEHGNSTGFYTAFKAVVPFEPVRELALRSKPTM